ncbi:MAG TPA: hypothetical protein VLA32_11000 [Anaerolineales bacterium]|jgi:hypothetical protein|nr:hypothetical protein [Anaerolineales bacterium]
MNHKIKKFTLILTITVLLVLLSAGMVFAKAKGTVKGTVTAMDGATFTVETRAGEIVVSATEEMISSLEVGMSVLIKGQWNEAVFEAEWVRQVGPKDKDKETEEGEGSQNAFCTGKKDTNHPLASKIVAKYGESTEVTEDMVMEWFCEGHSMGQIMLALTTQVLDGSDPAEVLAEREDGKGWGQIWKDRDLIGDERQGDPPGWVKKPGKGIPPGQLKKTPTATP